MRYILTNNRHVELVEADESGKILSSRGFQFGLLYYMIKNGKITFYMNDNENPWRNDVWTANIPLTINGEVYSTEEEVGAIMYEIMNDHLQEQIDELGQEDARLDQKIEDETDRAMNVEADLQEQIDSIDTDVIEQKLDNEITRSTAKDAEHDNLISGLTNTVNSEIARSTAKDAEHDGLLSGLTTSLNNEINRAINAENNLLSGLTSEISRATNAENALDVKIDTEITRSTAKDAEHDSLISGLTNTVNSEIQRALSAETEIANDLDDEITRANAEETRIEGKLDNEITRSTSKDTQHDNLISGLTSDLATETAARISADTNLQNQITAEVTRATNAETTLDSKIDTEIARSTGKDASHDVLISGLTDSLNSEISRATAAENALRNDLNAETQNRISGDTNLQNQINAEVIRSTNKDTEHDNLISALTDDLAAETAARIAADNALGLRIDNETAARISGDTNLQNQITSEVTRSTAEDARLSQLIDDEVTRATNAESALTNSLNNEITRATSAETVLHDEILAERNRALNAESGITVNLNNEIARATAVESGLTADIARIDGILPTKADKANAVASAEYVSANKIINFKNIDGAVISSINATDFIKDGMVDEVEIKVISGASYLAITFNADAGKEEIDIPLSDIFNPNNYYTKVEIDASQLAQDNKIGAISGDVISLGSKINTISGDVFTISGQVQTVSGMVEDIDLTPYATKDYVSGYTYDKNTIDTKIAESGQFDPTSYYTKSETDVLLTTKQNTLVAGSGITISGNVISASGTSDVNVIELTQAEYDNLQTIDPKALYVITDAEDVDMSNYYTKSGTQAFVSGYTYDKNTIDTKISQGGSFDPTSYYTKSDIDSQMSAKTDTTAFTAHISDNSIHLTSGDVQSALTAYTYDKSTIDTKISQGGSFDLPIYSGSDNTSLLYNYSGNVASNYSNAEGYMTTANGHFSHAEGEDTVASGYHAHAEGSGTTASGDSAHAEGIGTVAGGDSHAEGRNTSAMTSSHTEGNETSASNYSHAEGYQTVAVGDSSHAEGRKTSAMTTYSHAEGVGTITSNFAEHACGQYNISVHDNTYTSGSTIFSVGIGDNTTTRKNALEIRKNGDIYLKKNFNTIKLQDYLNNGGVDSGTVQTMIDESISGKADTSSLATVATSGSYNDLDNKPTIPTVPTSNTAFTNDAGYITSSALDGYATEQWVGQQGYLTQHQDISGKQDVSGMTAYTENTAFTAHTANTDIHVTTAQTAAWDAKSDFSGSYNDLTNKPTLFSGNYNDLTNKPTIPSSASQLTNDEGYITSAYTYDKNTIDSKIAQSGTFDPTSYYNKSDIDSQMSAKTDTTAFTAYTAATNTALGNKQDVSGMTAYTENTAFTAHTANTDVHVTTAQTAAWDTAATNASTALTKATTNETALGGVKLVKITQSAYDALATKDANTLYIVTD